jgi:hypothetical protein
LSALVSLTAAVYVRTGDAPRGDYSCEP